ncbi:uncharacterized protein LOC123541124 [Mercenaria mercenaria]|uniref:uncharacterized protein LOC123541124 n=1 Tax=Mercenaria mercenaria TaxID=6596 RepID=UPI00234E8177|nr:uncharacterized protein LOC123541124 [Mercenaria mercenaria]
MLLKEFSSVGSEIYVDNLTTSGSLGGFATMKTTSETRSSCVLLSKHVAAAGKGKEGRDGKLVAKEGDRLLGYVIQDTVKERGYDIAAERLDVDITTCDTVLKNSKGKTMKGSSKGKETLKGSLRGRKVHLWGAKSKPGKGVVTIPYYIMEGMDEHYIQVENLHGEHKRFAEPGDSVAIACADDPFQASVYPVSMNMGILNHKEIEEDNKRDIKTKRGKYLTAPLSAGLEQLGTRTGCTFDLTTE